MPRNRRIPRIRVVRWDVKEDGTSGKGHSLIVAGWERAGALIGFFAPYKTVPAKSKIATPDYIYAANPKGESERPCETVTPLARWLKYTPSSPRFNLAYDIDKEPLSKNEWVAA